jgi:hypothetical protein
MTWVYLLRHKDEVFPCFKTFYALVQTQFNVNIQALRSAFMSDKRILHQTSCPDTPPQTGVAKSSPTGGGPGIDVHHECSQVHVE